ncbi:MAG: HAMP domain-containing sensor histidine kinase [Gemmatimonadota bacterium]|nr:HAMP domain-containing sensor histidine kinase [Gemmatimonadota bacterium]
MIHPAAQGKAVLPTAFLPAERAPMDDVRRQHEKLAALPFVREFLDAMPNMAVVLNADRQIVLSNKAFAEYLAAGGQQHEVSEQRQSAFDNVLHSVLGHRTGEALGCVHSLETDGGCGTTPFCRECGAANVLLNSQQWHHLDVQECRLICGESGVREMALDFRVWAQPIEIHGENFTIFSLMDISHEKRREALEHIFFHDVLNTAGGVKGLADLVSKARLPEAAMREAAGMMSDSADQLIEEISAQRALSAAESGDLKLAPADVPSIDLIDRVVRVFHSYGVSRGKDIHVHDGVQDFRFVTDPVLLRRVLVNLVKNALEAERVGGVVTINAQADATSVTFTVHNQRAIPAKVQLQIFQRSFSTKGTGRGLGTYSVKLLTERYLNGRAWFISSEDEGTTFSVRCPRDVTRA